MGSYPEDPKEGWSSTELHNKLHMKGVPNHVGFAKNVKAEMTARDYEYKYVNVGNKKNKKIWVQKLKRNDLL